MKNPEFRLFLGAMFSGKTSRLLAAIDRHQYQKKSVVSFKPMIDNRYEKTKIVTHVGGSIDANNVNSGSDIVEYINNSSLSYDVIAVDEAFMIENSASALIELFQKGHSILVSSLEMSATCTPFDEIQKMTPWATSIDKCPAVCTLCDRDAFYTHKKFTDMKEITVGGEELYEPRCWRHHDYARGAK